MCHSHTLRRMDMPLRSTVTNHDRQFESQLFNAPARLLGSKHIHTTTFHPQSNGMVERLHRHLKDAIRCHENNSWVYMLPIVLLGIRAAWKEDLGATPADLVYGEPVRLPGEFLAPSPRSVFPPSNMTERLRNYFADLVPQPTVRHGQR